MKKIALVGVLLVLALGAGAFFYVTSSPFNVQPLDGRLHLSQEQAQEHFDAHHAQRTGLSKEWIIALMRGTPLPTATPALSEMTEGTNSLLNEALAFERFDAVTRMIAAGVDPNLDSHKILWAIFEGWTPFSPDWTTRLETDRVGALNIYLTQGGEHALRSPQGLTSLERASQVSFVPVEMLMREGANPWYDAQTKGRLMERLSLYVQSPEVLDLMHLIATSEHMPEPDKRGLEVVIGNLVDHSDALLKDEAVEMDIDTKSVDPQIKKIAQIVMTLSTSKNTPVWLIPQEFFDLQKADML